MLEKITILSIDSVLTVDSAKGRKFQMTNRPSFGITFCCEGQITYTHNGRKIISDPGHMVLLPKGESYTLYGNHPGRFPVINIQCKEDFDLREITAFAIKNPESYLKEFERLKELHMLGFDHLACMSILYGMLSRIEADSTIGNRLITSAKAYISDHYCDLALCNTKIAAYLGISEVYLRKLFHDILHTSPKQYLIDLRIRKAQQLLREDFSVSQVAGLCGYASAYHFSRAFHKAVGMSPTEYRATADLGVI